MKTVNSEELRDLARSVQSGNVRGCTWEVISEGDGFPRTIVFTKPVAIFSLGSSITVEPGDKAKIYARTSKKGKLISVTSSTGSAVLHRPKDGIGYNLEIEEKKPALAKAS